MTTTIYYHKHHIIPKYIGGTDDPKNIIKLTVEEHAKAHRLLFEEYGHWQDKIAWLGLSGRINSEDVIRLVQSENMKHLWNDPEFANKVSERAIIHAKQLWEDPVFRKKMVDIKTKQMVEQNNNPEYAKHRLECLREKHNDPKFKKKMSIVMLENSKKIWDDDEHRKKMSIVNANNAKNHWKDSQFRLMKSQQVRETMKTQWEDPLYREKMCVKIECPHCHKLTNRGNHKRWHGDNCKEKKS